MTLLKYFKPVERNDEKGGNKRIDCDGEEKGGIKRPKDDEKENVLDGGIEDVIDDFLQLERQYMAKDWFKAFLGEMKKKYFQAIKQALNEEFNKGCIIYPQPSEMYSFTQCPLESVKVVIIGQDPYHGPGQAHGLCFSVKKGVTPPPSLVNIFKELETDIPAFKRPSHGCLTSWTNQGVLLLNATLTVRKAEANSHASLGWQTFTDAIIAYINNNKSNVVFMLWGGYAQKKGKSVDEKRHLVLKATHPSPLGANKGGWFGSKHFSKANAYLQSNSLTPIDWCLA